MNIYMMMMSDNFDGENIEEIFYLSTTTFDHDSMFISDMIYKMRWEVCVLYFLKYNVILKYSLEVWFSIRDIFCEYYNKPIYFSNSNHIPLTVIRHLIRLELFEFESKYRGWSIRIIESLILEYSEFIPIYLLSRICRFGI